MQDIYAGRACGLVDGHAVSATVTITPRLNDYRATVLVSGEPAPRLNERGTLTTVGEPRRGWQYVADAAAEEALRTAVERAA